MDIINEIQSRVIKWVQSTDESEFSLYFKAGEKQRFKLIPYSEVYKSIFHITGVFHVTCPDTNFLLDAEIESIIQLDSKGITPTAKDLYEAYLKVNEKWNGIIFIEAEKRGYKLDFEGKTRNPFELMKPLLNQAIYYSLEGI